MSSVQTMALSSPSVYRVSQSDIYPRWPVFEDDEIAKVVEVLSSGKVNYWTGNEVKEFEKEFAAACNAKYGIALANGTVALEAALQGLGIKGGDEVVVTPRTFVASASSIVNCGAKPIFADVDPISGNITAENIAAVLSPRIKAIIAVHLAGWPCDMDPIIDLARANNIKVIEDCAQAHGATYKGKPVGSFGDAAAFSFCQDKIITTGGEGGMLVTSNYELWQEVWSRKDHGKKYHAVINGGRGSGFRWVHESIGTNWRMTEMQGSIGRIQLRKLHTWLALRRRNAGILSECFRNVPGMTVLDPPAHVEHAYYKYYVHIQPDVLAPGWSRDRILEEITGNGVPCFSGTCSEVYLEESFRKNGMQPQHRLPVARVLGEKSLMFLVHPTLTAENMKNMGRIVKEVLNEATCAEA